MVKFCRIYYFCVISKVKIKMKEIISLSLGKHSNHIASHFWNSQDENLKVQPEQGKEDVSEMEMEMNRGTHMVYQELESTR